MVKGFDFNIIGNNLELQLDETGLERFVRPFTQSAKNLRWF